MAFEVLVKNLADWLHAVIRSGAHQGYRRFIACELVIELDAGDGGQKKEKQQVFHLFATSCEARRRTELLIYSLVA